MNDLKINYIEFGATDLKAIRSFYEKAFGWTFTDYGPEYLAFNDGNLDGGFTTQSKPANGALVILYSAHLDQSKERVINAGAKIVQDIFDFPGGRRFHFADPSGNELAIWSDK